MTSQDPKTPRRIEISGPEDSAAGEPETTEPEAAGTSAEQEEAKTEEELAKLQEMLTDLERRCAYAEDQHLRVTAELQNYRRRVQQEKEQLIKFANEDLLTELIPILDNFERALEVKVDAPGAESLIAGVRMIYDQMQRVLEGRGVQRIDCLGADFDPHLHEAVDREETTALPPDVITAELAKGYTLNGRVIRPAKVRVTAAPDEK